MLSNNLEAMKLAFIAKDKSCINLCSINPTVNMLLSLSSQFCERTTKRLRMETFPLIKSLQGKEGSV